MPRSPWPALVAALGIMAADPLPAATYDLDATQVGGFYADGSADNKDFFQNYYIGYSTLTSIEERRNFFYFDLSAVTVPVVAAELSLILPFGGLIFGAGDPFEDYFLSGTSIPDTIVLDPMIDPTAGMAVFDTLGDPGMLIGGTGFSATSPPIVPTVGLEIVIPLDPAGVALINANLGGTLIIGGRMADVTPLAPVGEKSELIFGLSDVVTGTEMSGGIPTGLTVPFLTLTEIPEPGLPTLTLIAVLCAGAGRRRRDWKGR